jgi:hypothetical protein
LRLLRAPAPATLLTFDSSFSAGFGIAGELLCALVQCDGIHFTSHTLQQVQGKP